MSNREKCFCSLAFSAIAAAVVWSMNSPDAAAAMRLTLPR